MIGHFALVIVCQMLSLLTLLYPVFVFTKGRKFKQQDSVERMSGLIASGARLYLSEQTQVVSAIVAAVTVCFALVLPEVALWFAGGALASGLCGQLAMRVSTMYNARVVYAAEYGVKSALTEGLSAGVITGLLVSYSAEFLTFALFCFGVPITSCVAVCLGSSVMSMFAKLGGGIFTKGADVGADLVGKVETGLPEDDLRNPAVLADNVGDNVGDCAGAATDIFESKLVLLLAALYVVSSGGVSHWPTVILQLQYAIAVISTAGAFGTLYGLTYVLRSRAAVKSASDLTGLMYRGLARSSMATALLVGLYYLALPLFDTGSKISCAGVVCTCLVLGLCLGLAVMHTTRTYTDHAYRHVQQLVAASDSGPGANVIEGLALGLRYPLVPVLCIVGCVMMAWLACGTFDLHIIVALVGVGLLSQSAMVLVFDMYGPVTDNAGGIAEMSGLESVRKTTDLLDAAGNTIKAMTKGYSLAAMILTAMLCVVVFADYARHALFLTRVSIITAHNMISALLFVYIAGALIGGVAVYTFAGYAMQSVRIAGSSVVDEVRKQLSNNPGILDGSAEPDYQSTICSLTKYSIYAMRLPIASLCLVPATALLLVCTTGMHNFVVMLGGVLCGVVITGIPMAMAMISSGAAWDNAKKAIEALGEKGTAKHHAAVTGDTVGDPYKDTSGPAMNSAIKFVCVTAILVAVVCTSDTGPKIISTYVA